MIALIKAYSYELPRLDQEEGYKEAAGGGVWLLASARRKVNPWQRKQ